jgi:hypothetical protein
MGCQEGDLRLERPPATARLTGGLRRADHDVADAKDAVGVFLQVRRCLRAADPAGEPLAEGEYVGRPVDPAMPAVELAHLAVVDERKGNLTLGRQSQRTERGTDGSANRDEVAGRLAGDGDAHRSLAARRGLDARDAVFGIGNALVVYAQEQLAERVLGGLHVAEREVAFI